MSKMKKETKLSRRGFVAGAAALAGGSVLTACGPQGASAAPAGEGVVAAGDVSWESEYDLIVIGGGAAGLASAISAAETDSNASILLLERMGNIGGNSALSGGNFGAPNTDLQEKQGETDEHFSNDSPELYFADKRRLGAYRSNPVLTRVFAENALSGYEWLRGMGIEWGEVRFYEKAVPVPENPQGMHLQSMFNITFTDGEWEGAMTKGRHHNLGFYKDRENGGANILAMTERAESHSNIEIRTNADVTGFIREGIMSGDVLGVAVDSGEGAVYLKANRGVVLAAGGFSANGAMCAKYDSRLNPDGRNTGVDGVTGEALLAAIDIGADTMNMDFVQIRMQRSGINYGGELLIEKHGTYIDVDPEGNRFWKEMTDVVAYRYARLTEIYERGFDNWWSISDSSALEENKVEAEELEASLAAGTTVECATLEDLAATVGVSVDALKSTIDRYNGFVDAGVDEDFGQESHILQWKIETPPFYAVPRTYYRQYTCGGVMASEKAEVIDRRGEVIPRLYAAGEALGGVHGTERNGGCGWTECIVFGRIAGSEAVSLPPVA